MAEYINREALLKRMETRLNQLRGDYGDFDRYTNGFDEGLVAVEDAPTADVVEVKHGKWISASKKQGINIGMKCSLCGYSEFFNGNHNYCHKCGAKMGGDKNG